MVDILNRMLAWYDKHLKPQGRTEGELSVTNHN
jgi:hypothetical protein